MILWKVKLPPPYQQNTDGIMAVAGPLLTVTELKKKKKEIVESTYLMARELRT